MVLLPHKDGVITSLNTFQKYYSQSELQSFIENTLDENAIAVGPGIFFIFKDKLEEQLFLANRQKRHHNWKQITTRPTTTKEKFELVYAENEQLFNDFWLTCLALGRIPSNDEFEHTDKLKQLIGSHSKVFTLLNSLFENNEFDAAEHYRKEDLLVYFALSQFEKRKPYIQLPDQLQRDVKSFFGNYNTAIEIACELLYSISNTELIIENCLKAHESLPASVLLDNHSLIFHKDFIELLPALLRVYVGCGNQLFGDLDEIQLIKVHFHSGKVSFMEYENFDDSPLPLLKGRAKVKLAQQSIDFFDASEEYVSQPLYFKSHYLAGDYPNYKKQCSFDKKMALLLPTNIRYGLRLDALHALLESNQLEIKGFRFYTKKTSELTAIF